METATSAWAAEFGAKVELPPTLVTAHQVRVTFLQVAGQRVELVQPVGAGVVVRTPRSMQGRPDHVCFLCDHLDGAVAQSCSAGAVVAQPPVASEAFGGKRMVFLVIPDVGLVELVGP